jgi:serine/threonine protein phosphatase PrpC
MFGTVDSSGRCVKKRRHHVVEILHESKSRQSRADRVQRLVKEAVEKSGRDNTTALVIEIE